MNTSSPGSTDLAELPTSRRLRPDVTIYETDDGHVLLVGDAHHDLHLADAERDGLLDALAAGPLAPRDDRDAAPRVRDALASLVDAGLVDPARAHVAVTGSGALATALRSALARMGADTSAGGAPVAAADDAGLLADLPVTTPAAWVEGHRVVLSPPAVPAIHVVARHRAATLHRDTDRRVVRRPGTRGLRSAVPALAGPGLELAAVQVAAELLRADRPSHEVVVIDLVALTTSRHPVLPVPPAPR